jgi:hypothetical protein
MEIDDESEDGSFHCHSSDTGTDQRGVQLNSSGHGEYQQRTQIIAGASMGHTQRRQPPRACWLCEYHGNRTTNEVVRFIMDGIPHMSLNSLVEQSKFLLDQVDVGSDATTAEIRQHIMEHMLHPRVKLALQMQEMSRMQKEVSKCCISADTETGEQTINPQAMRVYLTLCSQISGVYKLGEDKLMYNQGSMDK